jgi:hypothetical protein
VHEAVEPAPTLAQVVVQPLERALVVHVDVEHVGGPWQVRGRAQREPPEAAEARQHDLGTRLLRLARDGERDALGRRDAGDEYPPAGEHQPSAQPVRHTTALWPPKPNEFDRATAGRPFARRASGRLTGT